MKSYRLYRLQTALLSMVLPVLIGYGCWTSHKIETTHKIEPIEINVNINVKIQDDLSQKFKKVDDTASAISDTEAEAALQKYIEQTK